ncbi:TetR/AcrR family transcriptional regulator C-terminal domain-containing protein [Streptomyces sp. NPDC014735]|uniref:TetR/AcrR family transcriptional regulator C-terminal domain-containing protein n=1 Tax=unclassified Streptomyces TaxID=2593676 RepID=UPI0036F6DEA0
MRHAPSADREPHGRLPQLVRRGLDRVHTERGEIGPAARGDPPRGCIEAMAPSEANRTASSRGTVSMCSTRCRSRPLSLSAWARSYRAAFAAHPRAIPLLTTSPVRAPKVLEQYEHAVRLLTGVGFATAEVMAVITALENLVLGSALDLAAPEAMWELPDESATPRLARALAAVGPGRADAAFELALEAFIGHCRALLAAGRSAAAPSHAP